MPAIKKNSYWSIRLNKDSSRKSLQVTSVKKDAVEYVLLKYPNITWSNTKERFLENFEPCTASEE